ncbi:hypothetical protein H2200_001180 [Cladophialophora chaetospira]|uniref:AB hydrolase-1 domain-containing protein n=1 Tax=Cladophialophora chaetospira TaxID=386627 RepID=A0AA38XKI6_9EURO|nr:hypothetical protein H2200_001180 [Cladophialophora chaetospira]
MTFELKTTHSKDGTKIAYYQQPTFPRISLATYLTAADVASLAQPARTTPSRKKSKMLEAIHLATGARFIFGVSSGALVTLKAALAAPPSHISRIAVFEPPWWPEADREAQMAWIKRYHAEVDQGQLAEAASTAMLGAQMGPAFFQSKLFPRGILVLLTRLMMRFDKSVGMSHDQKTDNESTQQTPVFKDLIPTFKNDIAVATEMLGERQLQALTAIEAKTLILGGSKSPPYLLRSVRELEKTISGARRVELQGMDHGGTFNKAQHGSPELFAEELKQFFSEGNGTPEVQGN